MKIIVVGGTGTVGRAVVKELAERHDVVIVGRKNGDIQVDIEDIASIQQFYKTVGKMDALVVATGNVHFGALSEMNAELYQIGINSKLMGQVNLVSMGIPYLKNEGSFTLTSGILSHEPIRYGSSAAMVNAAINAFVISSAIEMPRGIRINAISPTVLTESMHEYGPYFRGFVSVPAAKVALAYSKSVEGAQTGRVYEVNG